MVELEVLDLPSPDQDRRRPAHPHHLVGVIPEVKLSIDAWNLHVDPPSPFRPDPGQARAQGDTTGVSGGLDGERGLVHVGR